MVELNHNVKNIQTSGVVKAGHGVVFAIHVIETSGSNATLTLRNGTDSSAPEEFHIHGHHMIRMEHINRRFENGIYAHMTGSTGAEYFIIYK